MVADDQFYGTPADYARLLDYLGEPEDVSLHPWPLVQSPPLILSRMDALASAQVMIVSRRLGQPSIIGPGDPTLVESTKAAFWNRVNWERLRPNSSEGLVDSNASPVLLWIPAGSTAEALRAGSIGSQADSMGAVWKRLRTVDEPRHELDTAQGVPRSGGWKPETFARTSTSGAATSRSCSRCLKRCRLRDGGARILVDSGA